MSSSIQDPIEYLYSLEHFGIKLGLERMERFMHLLDHPHQKYKSIHVAGTNGKGSVCAYLAKILQQAGYKVGLYTSPHLIKFNERIQINGKSISDESLGNIVTYIRDHVADTETTFFEFTTALAFQYFAQEGIDIAIVEVGLGGDLDATTVVHPIVSVITNISLEHTQALGSTKLEIAEKKAGVIKEGVPLITAEKDPEILAYFRNVCREKKTELIQISALSFSIIDSTNHMQHFTFNNKKYFISMQGDHQITNAITALVALQEMQEKGITIPQKSIEIGLQQTHWPARLDLISQNPKIILDGAHNADATSHIIPYIKNLEKRKVLLLAISKGKAVELMVKDLVPLFDHIIITQSSFKPEEISIIAQHARKYSNNIEEIQKSTDAFIRALELVGKDDTLFITGSLYMVGDIMRYMKKHKTKL